MGVAKGIVFFFCIRRAVDTAVYSYKGYDYQVRYARKIDESGLLSEKVDQSLLVRGGGIFVKLLVGVFTI